jgi:hypothetical protein
VRRATADVEKWTIRTRRRQSTMVIRVQHAQSSLFGPYAAMLKLARVGNDTLGCVLLGHHTALSLRKANNTMRSSINPS